MFCHTLRRSGLLSFVIVVVVVVVVVVCLFVCLFCFPHRLVPEERLNEGTLTTPVPRQDPFLCRLVFDSPPTRPGPGRHLASGTRAVESTLSFGVIGFGGRIYNRHTMKLD